MADITAGSKYIRAGFTGKPLRYTDGREDPEWSQCPCCLSYHHASSNSCAGKRDATYIRCDAVMGEVQCERMLDHMGAHQAESRALRMEWEFLAWKNKSDGASGG